MRKNDVIPGAQAFGAFVLRHHSSRVSSSVFFATSLMDRISRHRRWLARAALLGMVLVVASTLVPAIPRSIALSVPVPGVAQDVRSIRAEIRQEEAVLHALELNFPQGAPLEIRQTCELSPGVYTLHFTEVYRDGSLRRYLGRLRSPAEGLVHVQLRAVSR